MTMTDRDLITLAQAVTAGLFPSIDAARKASTRDPRFPEPATRRGTAFMYDAEALRDYRGNLAGEPQPGTAPHAEGREWRPIPGAGYYEASHRGKVRSVDRFIDGKFYPETELAMRPNNQGYLITDVRRDDKSKWTDTVHKFVLLAHVGEPGPGEETLHGKGGQLDNRYPENIRWGTRAQNLADMAANRPPREPKPPKVCPRCGREHEGRGRRCPECVAGLGMAAAPLLVKNPDPDVIAQMLDYPSPGGLVKLAVKHGGLVMHVGPCAVTASEPGIRHPESPPSWLRRVLFRREASGRNSDAE